MSIFFKTDFNSMTEEKFQQAILFLEMYLRSTTEFSRIELGAIISELKKYGHVSGMKRIKMAINDCIEMYFGLSIGKKSEIDRKLVANKLPSVLDMSVLYSNRLSRSINRPNIRNEIDYYLLKGAIESRLLIEDQRLKAEKLIEAFERRI